MVLEKFDSFGKRLDYLLGGKSNRDAAKEILISHELIGLWRRGKGNPTLDKLEILKKYFKEKYLWLVSGEGNPDEPINLKPDLKSKKLRTVPVIATVPCGIAVNQWDEEIKEYMELPRVGHLNSPFLLIAKGDSMKPYILNGDYLLCSDEPKKIKARTAVVVSYKSDPGNVIANAKLITFPDKHHVNLYSVNTFFEPQLVKLSDIYKIYKIVRIIRDVN